MNERPHTSILEQEILSLFQPFPLSVFVDGTVGAGGHAKLFLESHEEIQQLFGFDQDTDALHIAKNTLKPWSHKVSLIHSNFEHFAQKLAEKGIFSSNGFFFDLGVSSMQLDQAHKGFSLYKEGPLDMRMNPENPLTAEHIISHYSEKELGHIFHTYGEEPRWRAAAKAIVQERKHTKITTTTQLADLLLRALKTKTRGRLHPATLVFQALRIFINRELEVLEHTLRTAISFLSSGGVIGVISFHSFEDRIVKNIFRSASRTGKDALPLIKLLTKKPVVPTHSEIRRNARARSAKLRCAQKL